MFAIGGKKKQKKGDQTLLTKSTQARSTSDTDQLEYAHQQQRQQQHQHQHQTRLSNTHRKGIKRMESVTNLLGNILSLDDETKTTSGSTRHNAKLNQTHSTVVSSSLIPAKKRRSLDLDFSSFWKDSKEGNGERLSTSKAKAGATSSTTGTNATSSSGGGGGGNEHDGDESTDASGGITGGSGAAASASASASAAANTASAAAATAPNVATTSQNYYADKLMEKAISMIIPNEIYDDQTNKMLQDRQLMAKLRPPLSFALMQKNSNNLHQRNSDIYIVFNLILKYVNWMDPYYTIGITMLITHMILKPVLFICLPWMLLVVNTLLPHYLMIYPQDTSYNNEYLEVNPTPLQQALEPAKLPKPVPLFSKEFFMNLTDTQNFMTLQSHIFDFQTWLFADYLYFKNEQVSSFIVLSCLVMIASTLLWFNHIFWFLLNHSWIVKLYWVFLLWGFIIAMHPNQRCKILSWVYEEDTRLDIQNRVNKIEDKLTSILVDDGLQLDLQLHNNGDTNKTCRKLVEVYELQKLNQESNIWELVGFTLDFYSINDGVRKYNYTIKKLNQEIARAQFSSGSAIVDDNGTDIATAPTIIEATSFGGGSASGDGVGGGHEHNYLTLSKRESINLVKPPQGYKFTSQSKWTIDYDVANWVQSNFIQDLVIIDDDEKWAYDVTIQHITYDGDDAAEEEKKQQVAVASSGQEDSNNGNHGGPLADKLTDLYDGEIYRRRRWLRYVVRETYKDIDRPPVQQSHLASWVT